MSNVSIYFEKVSGKKIFCFFHHPDIPRNRIVIMSHGFKGTSTGTSRAYVNFARFLSKNNITVLRFDQPNCGNSDGDFIDVSFDEWVNTIDYLAQKYLAQDYQVALLGNSMGATASVVATSRKELQGKIACLLLWVPDPKTTLGPLDPEAIYEENGELFKARFWQEAKQSKFFDALRRFKGGIHLVYGEHDIHITKELRQEVIEIVREKGQPVMTLSGQNHSLWPHDCLQKVFCDELKMLYKCFLDK
jgi:esterase/lipase